MSVTAVPIRPLKKGSLVKLWIAVLVLAILAGAAAWYTTGRMQWTRTPSGLQYQVVTEGQGARPGDMDVVTFDYVGRLSNGREFDSTEGREPAEIPLFGVVPGFSEGLKLMNKGATYRLRIPPEIGYGPRGQPPVIPPNATLEFEVTLRDFRPLTAEEQQQIRQMQQMQMQQMQQQMQGAGGAGGAGAGGAGGSGGAGGANPPTPTPAPSQRGGR